MRTSLAVALGLTLVFVAGELCLAAARSSQIASQTRPNPYLPSKCLTYLERYDTAKLPKSPGWNPNRGVWMSEYVFLLKYHSSQKPSYDLMMSMRALIEEATQAGYQAYILMEMDDRQFNREMTRMNLPDDLLDVVISYTREMVEAAYPALYNPNNANTGKLGAKKWGGADPFLHPGPRLAYMPLVWFMSTYKLYKFAWMAEYDVRYSGHWGRFLNTALRMAIDAPGSAENLAVHTPTYAVNDTLPFIPAGNLPDLVTFAPLHSDDGFWDHTWVGYERPPHDVAAAALMAWGGSRRMYDILHANSLAGRGGYYEVFITSLARKLKNVKVVALNTSPATAPGPPETAWNRSTWHSCRPHAQLAYDAWRAGGACINSSLFHPVKFEAAGPADLKAYCE